MDAAEYKHLVLGLIFLKYISDSFSEHQAEVLQRVSDPDSDFFIGDDPADHQAGLEDRDYYTQDNVFWVPAEARWEELRAPGQATGHQPANRPGPGGDRE
jgi:type I restriction enzyme M protein